ncbi:zinc finger protein 862-like [Dreissena polymorpha]|uniref:zinc finger protein 862-like n=1 Tax=Dreissena polymorpha TaxID=45954 RepID=UPI002264FBE3|nr:zinc finger protein 862-like [Dreissena polymorpha]
MMDGSTDISGDEQEAVFVRVCNRGHVTERFLTIGTPTSTSSEHLFDFVINHFEEYNIDEDRLAGMGSDGAANMVRVRTGLSTRLRQEINAEMVNIHCLCHRLELAFRDVVKSSKLYDKLMTLLIGLHYFYKKQYKNKSGILRAIEAVGNQGRLPPRVTGTRWMPHLFNGINCLMLTFRAFEAHLSTLCHSDPKAEGLLRINAKQKFCCVHAVPSGKFQTLTKMLKISRTIVDVFFSLGL